MLTVSIDRLEQIELEREQTVSDPSFQAWMKELKVGRMAKKPNDQASDMMSLWKDNEGRSHSFKQIVACLEEKAYL